MIRYLLYPYLLVHALALLGPFADFPYSPKMILFILAVLILFSFGYDLGSRSRLPKEDYGRTDSLAVRYLSFVAPLVLVGSLGYVYWLLERGASFALLFQDTQAVRSVVEGTSLIKRIFAFFAFQSYLFIPILVTSRLGDFTRFVRLLYYLSMTLMSFAVLLQAGRLFFLVMAVLIYAGHAAQKAAALRARPLSLEVKIFLSLVLSIGIPFMYLIATQRPGIAEIEVSIAAQRYRYAQTFFESLPDDLEYFVLSIYSYFISPQTHLARWVEVEKTMVSFVDPFYGTLSTYFGEFFAPRALPSEALPAYLAIGGTVSSWRTGFAPYLANYGFLGMTLIVTLLGFYFGRIAKSFIKSRNLLSYLSLVWFTYFVFFFFFFYPSFDNPFLNNALVLFLLYLASRLQRRKFPVSISRVTNAQKTRS